MRGVHLRPGRPLLAPSARPWAGGLLACCAILVTVLGALFAHQTKADWLDHAVDAPVITWLGGRLNGAVLAATAVPVANGLVEGLLKPLVHRTYLGNVVYPSGHTAAIFALAATFTVLLLVAPSTAEAGALRVLIPAAAGAAGVVVAIGLIGLRFHYFTDTVAGAATGIGTVCGLALVLDLPSARRWLARAGPPPARERQGQAARAGTGASP